MTHECEYEPRKSMIAMGNAIRILNAFPLVQRVQTYTPVFKLLSPTPSRLPLFPPKQDPAEPVYANSLRRELGVAG